VGSSAYRAHNQALSLALRQDNHLLQLSAAYQDIPFEGYPNQRMDMTSNRSTQLNARYRGQYDWGELQAQAYSQRTDHRMDMGPDRDTTAPACPWTRPAARWGPRCRPA
jgi:iron complex outermembrane receptor protein